MIKFKTDLFAQFLDNGNYKVSRPFVVEFSHSNQIYSLVVPVGRITDLTSTPRALWSVLSKDDREYLESAIFHDELYKAGGEINVLNLKTNEFEFLRISRLRADQLFKEGAEVLGASWIKQNLIYYGVRAGGASAWKAKK